MNCKDDRRPEQKQSNNKIRIGITGATGGLGRRLTEMAREQGYAVKCLVRTTSKTEKLTAHGLELFIGDVCTESTLIDFIRNVDVCVHLAAHVGTGTRQQYLKANVEGTDNICRAITKYNPNCRLVYCSTISVLRLNPYLKFLSTNYALSKFYAEKKVESYVENQHLKATIIYPGLIYGPQDMNFVPAVINFLKEGKMIFVSGGEKDAPLVYIDDLCELFLIASTKEASIGGKYIGVGNLEIGIHDFVKKIAKKTGNSFPRYTIPKLLILPFAVVMEFFYDLLHIKKTPLLSKRAVDVMSINFTRYAKNISSESGWVPKVTIDHGLDSALQWYAKHSGAS